MESIPSDRLVRLLNILEKNIRDGVRVCPLADPVRTPFEREKRVDIFVRATGWVRDVELIMNFLAKRRMWSSENYFST